MENVFDVVSYDEVTDILNSKDQSYKILKDILSPIFNIGEEFSKLYFLDMDDVRTDRKSSKETYSEIFKKFVDDAEKLSDNDENCIVVLYAQTIDMTDKDAFETAVKTNWFLYADSETDDDSPLTFMYTKTELQKKIHNILYNDMLDLLNRQGVMDNNMLPTMEDYKIPYYISYTIFEKVDKSGATAMRALKYIFVNFERPISNSDDIRAIIEKIAENEGVDPECIFIFGISRLGEDAVDYNNEDLDEMEYFGDEDDDNAPALNTMPFFHNCITYRLNGEEKTYDSYQNIDISADEFTKIHLAKSIIIEEENLTPEEAEELEILGIDIIDDDDEC